MSQISDILDTEFRWQCEILLEEISPANVPLSALIPNHNFILRRDSADQCIMLDGSILGVGAFNFIKYKPTTHYRDGALGWIVPFT